MVAVDKDGKSTAIKQISPTTQKQKQRWDNALKRKNHRSMTKTQS